MVGIVEWSSAMGRRRAAVSLGGWSARPFETSNGIWFWKRLLIPMATEPRRRTCLASQCGRCGTRSPNIWQKTLTCLVTWARRAGV